VSSQAELPVELERFGANLRRERNARNLTQEKLAELADLNIRTVQKIEAGELNVLITTAIRIQRALKCPWDSLLPPVRR
jgi:transcriptional regulator with XRE-family HTH domain